MWSACSGGCDLVHLGRRGLSGAWFVVKDGVVQKGVVLLAQKNVVQEGVVLLAQEGMILLAQEGMILLAQEGVVLLAQGVCS